MATQNSSFCINRKEKIASRCLVICVGLAKFDKCVNIPDIDDIKVDIQSYVSTFGSHPNYRLLTNRTDRTCSKEEMTEYFRSIFENNLYDSDSGCIRYNALLITLSGHCTRNSMICSDGEQLPFTEILSIFTENWKNRNLISNLPKLIFVDGQRGFDYTQWMVEMEEKAEKVEDQEEDIACIEAKMTDYDLDGTYSVIMRSSSAVLDSKAFSGQLGWNITQIFNGHFEKGDDVTFYDIARDLKNRVYEVASYSNYQFAVEFLEHDMDIDDVIFPSKFIKSPVMTPLEVELEEELKPKSKLNSKGSRMSKLSIDFRSKLLKSPRSKNPKSPKPFKFEESPRDSESVHSVNQNMSRRKMMRSTSVFNLNLNLKSFRNRSSTKDENDMMKDSQSKSSVNYNQNQYNALTRSPSSPYSQSQSQSQSRTRSATHSHSKSMSLTPSSITPHITPCPHPQHPKTTIPRFSLVEEDGQMIPENRSVMMDYEGMDGWSQRLCVLNRKKGKTKVLVEWNFIMGGVNYTVGLLHSQKSDPTQKATMRLIVNGEEMWSQKSSPRQFYVQPQEHLVLGVNVVFDVMEQEFVYSLSINGKEHERYFEEWKAIQSMTMHRHYHHHHHYSHSVGGHGNWWNQSMWNQQLLNHLYIDTMRNGMESKIH